MNQTQNAYNAICFMNLQQILIYVIQVQFLIVILIQLLKFVLFVILVSNHP